MTDRRSRYYDRNAPCNCSMCLAERRMAAKQELMKGMFLKVDSADLKAEAEKAKKYTTDFYMWLDTIIALMNQLKGRKITLEPLYRTHRPAYVVRKGTVRLGYSIEITEPGKWRYGSRSVVSAYEPLPSWLEDTFGSPSAKPKRSPKKRRLPPPAPRWDVWLNELQPAPAATTGDAAPVGPTPPKISDWMKKNAKALPEGSYKLFGTKPALEAYSKELKEAIEKEKAEKAVLVDSLTALGKEALKTIEEGYASPKKKKKKMPGFYYDTTTNQLTEEKRK